MRCRIIRYAIHSSVLLRDRVLVDSRLLIRNLTEVHRRRSFCSSTGFLAICSAFRHRGSFGYCRQVELELRCLAPVLESLGCLNLCLCCFICICDRQAFGISILHCCRQLIRSIIGLRHCHSNRMRCRIIRYAIHSSVLLRNRVLVDSGFLICDLTEVYNGLFLCCYTRLLTLCNSFRHRSAICCFQVESKAVCLTPVRKIFSCFN